MIHYQSLSLALLAISVALLLAGKAAYFTINMDIAHEYRGSAIGVMDAFFSTATLLATTLSGFLIQITGHYDMPILLLISLCLSSAILVLCFQQPERYGSLKTFNESKTSVSH